MHREVAGDVEERRIALQIVEVGVGDVDDGAAGWQLAEPARELAAQLQERVRVALDDDAMPAMPVGMKRQVSRQRREALAVRRRRPGSQGQENNANRAEEPSSHEITQFQ